MNDCKQISLRRLKVFEDFIGVILLNEIPLEEINLVFITKHVSGNVPSSVVYKTMNINQKLRTIYTTIIVFCKLKVKGSD